MVKCIINPMHKYLTGITLLLLTLSFPSFFINKIDVSAQELTPQSQELPLAQPFKTESRFEVKEEVKTTVIEKETKYKDDPEMEVGEEKVLEEGEDGKKTKTYKVTYFEGDEYSRELIKTEVVNPKDKQILRGTKIVWRTINTPDGEIRYWKKMRVWATHYDKHCRGCDEWTAIGMKQGKGVIAVDPKVIKMRSKIYVPGYGPAVAGDTGGAIKGNIIDLGFEDARTAGWSARYVDIYLMDKAPI